MYVEVVFDGVVMVLGCFNVLLVMVMVSVVLVSLLLKRLVVIDVVVSLFIL